MRCAREEKVNEISSDELIKMVIEEDNHINTIGYSIVGNYKTDKISLLTEHSYIGHIIFHGCEINEVVLKNTLIVYCRFAGVTINKLKLINCVVEYCDFDDYCTFGNIECYNSKIYNNTINGCTIGDIIAEHTTILETGISKSKYRGAIFSNSTIRDNYFANNMKMGVEKLTFMDCSIVDNKLFDSTVAYLYCYKCRVLHNYTSKTTFNHSQSYESNITLNQICPEEGSFIAYKKVFGINKNALEYLYDNMIQIRPADGKEFIKEAEEYIAVLEIPADAKRSSGGSDKCRADKVKVLRLEDMDGNEINTVGYSIIGITTLVSYQMGYHIKPMPICTYEAGKTIYSDSFDENKFNTCSNGIHFFMSKELAKDFKY